MPSHPNAIRTRAVVLALAAVAAALAFAAARGHDVPRAVAPAPVVHTVPVVPARPTQGAVSAVLAAAFAEQLPGATLTYELTLLNLNHEKGTATFALRDLRAVLGDVTITVRIVRASSLTLQMPGASGRALRLIHHGYAFDFAFAGGYPLRADQLWHLVTDPRLVAVGA